MEYYEKFRAIHAVGFSGFMSVIVASEGEEFNGKKTEFNIGVVAQRIKVASAFFRKEPPDIFFNARLDLAGKGLDDIFRDDIGLCIRRVLFIRSIDIKLPIDEHTFQNARSAFMEINATLQKTRMYQKLKSNLVGKLAQHMLGIQ